ncbi:MAG: DUF2071 domain-containing protein [Planctomycetes bacterium]|nr:DUF2071 domain-containing protein [Planctomycetota bacterium]MCB9886660.1 DUF2071 domain-containing protein [Planctomycetota bacterium]
MFAALRRHPFAVQAFFRHSLVLTFAYPEELLQPLLPPGLTVDSHEGAGFVAVAMVQTEGLRPARLPAWCGRDFFLAGYRIFARYRRRDGKVLRGLRILRSYTDRRFMVWSGNLFTGYNYRKCTSRCERTAQTLDCTITTAGGHADVSVRAHIGEAASAPPAGSPFADLKAARRFAGPMPFTFGYEPKTRSMVIVQGEREDWQPMPVHVERFRCAFLEQPPFAAAPLRLANAFFVENIPYRWRRGEVERLADDVVGEDVR